MFVWGVTGLKANAESGSLQPLGGEVLRCVSAAGYMVNVWTTICTASRCVVPWPRWFKWYAMHYWWRRKCTLTHWSWGARALFSAGGRRRWNLTPHLRSSDTISPHRLQHKENMDFFYFFFFLHMINWVRLPQTSLMRVTHEMHEICPWNTLIFSHACECVLTANVHRKGKKGIHTIISLFFLQLAPTGKKTKNKKRSGGRTKLGAFLKERIRLGK